MEGVGAISNLHLHPLNRSSSDFNVDGFEPPTDHGAFIADRGRGRPGFFDAAGIEILHGRSFSDADRPDTQPIANISEAMARRFWADGDGDGRVVRRRDDDPLGSSSPWRATRRYGRSARRPATSSISRTRAVHTVAGSRGEDGDGPGADGARAPGRRSRGGPRPVRP